MSTPTEPVDRRRAVGLVRASLPGPGEPPVVWLVEAEPGLGRSTLLDHLAEAEPDAHVLRAAGVAWEASQPWALLGQLTGAPDGAWWDGPFDGARDLVAGLASEVTAPTPSAPQVTLVLVDDADLADAASLEALLTAARHHRDRAFVVVLTRRLGGPDTPARVVLDQARATVLRLAPLTPTEVGALAARAGVTLTPAQAAHLAQHTGGLPRHVDELLDVLPPDAWRVRGPRLPAPASVQEQVRTRLAPLGAAATRLVQTVAVLRDPVGRDLAASVAELDDVVAAIDEAERHGLVVAVDRTSTVVLEVPGLLVRAAVLELMGTARRTELHRAAAARVDDPAAALEHAVEAAPGHDEDLAGRLDELAQQRGGDGGWAEAAHLYLLASRTSDDRPARQRRLLLAVDALVGSGDVPAAAGYLPEIESFPETAMRNAVLGYLAIVRGRESEAGARLTRAWQLTRTGHAPVEAALVSQRHVLHHLARCDGAALVEWADRTVDLVGADHPTAVEAQAIRGLGLGSTGRLDEAFASYDALSAHQGRGAVGQRVLMGAGWLHLAADDVDRARAELETAIPVDFLGGSTRISLWAHCWLARTHFVAGEWDRALGVVEAGLARSEAAGMTLMVPLLRWTETQVRALRGEWAQAEDSVRSAAAVSRGYPVMTVPSCLGRAALCEARADYTGVLTALEPLLAPGVSADLAEPGFWPWTDVYANALVVEGRHEEAATFLDEHEARAHDRGHRSSQARLAYARGRLLGARGDIDAARRTFEAARQQLRTLTLPYDAARVDFAYGQTLRRAGKRREADAVIAAALERYVALGATTYVRRCERELKAGGVRATPRDRPGQTLTPQEQAVAGLVARGASNREVAAELFLSVKTVQFHLTRVYGKLGIRSRSELAASADALLGEESGS